MARRPRRWPVDLGRPATWEDLREIPEDTVGEIVNGEVLVTPRPGVPHMRVTSGLGMLLGPPFQLRSGGPGGWIIMDEPRIQFGEDIRVPDLAGWREERWTGLSRTGPITIVPEWVCEVHSPSTRGDDRGAKRDLYARARVAHLWLLDPEVRTLEVYRLVEDGWLLGGTFADDQRVRAEPFDAVELDLSLLWERAVPDEPLDDE